MWQVDMEHKGLLTIYNYGFLDLKVLNFIVKSNVTFFVQSWGMKNQWDEDEKLV